MQLYHHIQELRSALAAARAAGKRIAFVPTMGNLHAGHISLVQAAHSHGEFIVASIFVNPMQFGANEDYDSYPRTLEADADKLAAAGTDALFAPSVNEMYPGGLSSQTVVKVSGLTDKLCGKARPGHFDGVATVVTKLFNIVQPDTAIFGQKDFQQLMVIRQMVADLNMPINVVGITTARADSGLALSSRNGYLNDRQSRAAAGIYATLTNIRDAIINGDTNFDALIVSASKYLQENGFEVNYVAICNTDTLKPASSTTTNKVILIAAKLGGTRLIDNLLV